MSHECIIGIGSNINPEQNFAAALFYLRQDHQLIAVSSRIKTEPIGITEQPEFLNGAAKVMTQMGKEDFGRYLKVVEDRLKEIVRLLNLVRVPLTLTSLSGMVK